MKPACWHCCHAFEGDALALPTRYDQLRKKFWTKGHFCSFSCMKAFAIDSYGDQHGSIVASNVVMYRRRMCPEARGGVRRAPNRYSLQLFGGSMTIEEFRAHADTAPSPENRRVVETMEDHGTQTTTTVSSDSAATFLTRTDERAAAKKLKEISASETENESLKLKRNKPLQRSHNDLENALGLVIKPR